MIELLVFPLGRAGAAKHLAQENYFIESADKNSGTVYLYFYENSRAIILGKSLEVEQEVYSQKKVTRVYRRGSGGGTVLHFYGSLNYGIVLNTQTFKEFSSIPDSYNLLLSAITESLSGKSQLLRKGISDICMYQNRNYRKLSGNSQIRKRGWVLHHGTFIYDNAELKKISYYLRPPLKQPEYRKNRDHRSFMAKILPIKSRPILIAGIIKGIHKYFEKSHGPCTLRYLRNYALTIPAILNLPAVEHPKTGI